MDLRDLFDSKYDELCSEAAEVGLDWPATSALIYGPGKLEGVPLSSEYKGKLAVWVNPIRHKEDGRPGYLINFHTNKHGGVTKSVTVFEPREKDDYWSRARQLRDQHAQKGREEERKKREDAQERKKAEDAAKREADWQRDKAAFEAAPRLDVNFPYLVRKNIAHLPEFFDIREMTAKRQYGQGSDEVYLAYALRDANGNYVGMKRIWADGKKKKLSSGRTERSYKGAFTVIGDPGSSLVVYVAEGLATAVSIFLATGCAARVRRFNRGFSASCFDRWYCWRRQSAITVSKLRNEWRPRWRRWCASDL